VTPAGARAFGQALAAQSRKDHHAGAGRPSTLFGVQRLGLDAPTPPPTV